MKRLRFLFPIISCICIGITLASIIVAGIETPIKILIAFSIILAVFILYEIQNANQQLGKLLYFVRTMYISIETNRLNPTEKKPAKDILSEDIKYEKDMNKFKFELAGANILTPIINIILLLIGCISAYFAFGYLK
jgi:hypothetical protein